MGYIVGQKMKQTPNKFVNDRPSGWTALSAASQQCCPLQRRYEHKVMYKILLLIIIFIPISSYGGELPESTEVTLQNSESLGVKISEQDSGSSKVKLFSLEFPQQYKGCIAGRVSSTLLNSEGNEITSSSMDYQVGTSSPSVLAHFQPEDTDMAFVIQYCCGEGKAPGCKIGLVIDSAKELGSWK